MKNTIYTIGEIQPADKKELSKVEALINHSLPEDYKAFITEFGYGNLNELVLFSEPDELFFKENFAEYLDLWEWEIPLQEKALAGVVVAQSVDGDTIIAIEDTEKPYLLLPRHSQYPRQFVQFWDIISWYEQEYQLKILYFDSYYQQEWRFFHIEGDFSDIKLEKISILYRKFKNYHAIDTIFGIEDYQPKCVLQNIGGWVWFNLDTGEIRMKYQQMHTKKSNEIITFLEQYTIMKVPDK